MAVKELKRTGEARGETVQGDRGEAVCGRVARETRKSPVESDLADLNGRTALGTGGSRGLGSAMCRTLARAGAQAAVHSAHDAVRAVAVKREIVAGGGRAVPVGGDFHDAGAVRVMVVRAQDRADGMGMYAATSPQPVRAVRPEPEEDDRDWSLGRPADMDEYTDHPSPAGSRRN